MPTPKEQYEAQEIAFSNMSPADKEAEITRRKAEIQTHFDSLPEEHKKSFREKLKPIDPNIIEEYVVITKRGLEYTDLHNELIRDTSADDSVDSNIVPDRVVTITNEKKHNPRLTNYNLYSGEAEKLKNDSRVETVERKIDNYYTPYKYQDGNFNKSTSASGENQNWGLLRHINKTNNFGSSTNDPGGTYDYVLDGTGVDVVIMDTGINANHPEVDDEDGTTRLQEIDWFQAAGVSGYSMPGDMYTDTHGHGSHVTGTVAGKKFGWAKNSHIYIFKMMNGGVNLNDVESSGYTGYDLVRLWHTKKNDPSDAAYTGRPTVINMSFGKTSWWVLISPYGDGEDYLDGYGAISKCTYRGTDYTASNKNLTDLEDYGMKPVDYTYKYINSTWYTVREIPSYSSTDETEMQQMADAGIIVCKAAGNDGAFMDEPNGTDYNNRLWVYYSGNTGSDVYLTPHKGFIQWSGNSAPTFVVGALDNTSYDSVYDKTTTFSNRGPAVNIWFAGDYILSMDISSALYDYYWDGGYKQSKKSGTSMASPQCAGMCALLLQVHSDWTPLQVFNWIRDNATATVYSTGSSTDYTVETSLMGSEQKVAYFPMAGRTPFGYGSS